MISARIVILSLLFGWVAGCAQVGTQPVDLATPTPTAPSIPSPTALVEATLPPGWETHSASANDGQCGYSISHPSDMDGTSQGTYSWILNNAGTEPSGVVPNFVYVSVIPDDFQSGEPGVIYNYDPAEAETLLNMQVGESKPQRDDPNIAEWFTYTRLPDTVINNHAAQTYENTKPWEFPLGTKEIRYYLQANGCTYLIGGYMDTTGSNQPGAINEELFDQVIATFQVNP